MIFLMEARISSMLGSLVASSLVIPHLLEVPPQRPPCLPTTINDCAATQHHRASHGAIPWQVEENGATPPFELSPKDGALKAKNT